MFQFNNMAISLPYLPTHLNLGSPTPSFQFPSPPLHRSIKKVQECSPDFHRLRLDRPRLRSRLTLRGLTAPRKPWAFGEQDSHLFFATYVRIFTRLSSKGPHGSFFYGKVYAPLPLCKTPYKIRCFGGALEPR